MFWTKQSWFKKTKKLWGLLRSIKLQNNYTSSHHAPRQKSRSSWYYNMDNVYELSIIRISVKKLSLVWFLPMYWHDSNFLLHISGLVFQIYITDFLVCCLLNDIKKGQIVFHLIVGWPQNATNQNGCVLLMYIRLKVI